MFSGVFCIISSVVLSILPLLSQTNIGWPRVLFSFCRSSDILGELIPVKLGVAWPEKVANQMIKYSPFKGKNVWRNLRIFYGWYCWWKISCTSWDGKYPIIYKLQGLAPYQVVVWDFWTINSSSWTTPPEVKFWLISDIDVASATYLAKFHVILEWFDQVGNARLRIFSYKKQSLYTSGVQCIHLIYIHSLLTK